MCFIAPRIQKVRIDDCRHSSPLVFAGFDQFDSVCFGTVNRLEVFGRATYFDVFVFRFPPEGLLAGFSAVYVTPFEEGLEAATRCVRRTPEDDPDVGGGNPWTVHASDRLEGIAERWLTVVVRGDVRGLFSAHSYVDSLLEPLKSPHPAEYIRGDCRVAFSLRCHHLFSEAGADSPRELGIDEHGVEPPTSVPGMNRKNYEGIGEHYSGVAPRQRVSPRGVQP